MTCANTRVNELADRIVQRIENELPETRKFLQFAKILGSLLREDNAPNLDRHQFNELVTLVQRQAMKKKGKRELVYQTLPLFVKKRYDRAAKRKPPQRRNRSSSDRIYMPLYRSGIDDDMERGYDYGDDNKGYVHNLQSPYLEEARC